MTDFAETRAQFRLPDGVVYLDGNSLGPLPAGVMQRAKDVIESEWGDLLIRGWNKAGWMAMPGRIGDRIGRLVGAPAGTVVVGDTLSIKVYQALASALAMRPDRSVILSDTGNFPSDLYMAQGLIASLGQGHRLVTVAPERIADALGETVAVLMLTHVDYQTGRMYDVEALTRRAHDAGAIVMWDLAHTAGAVPVDIGTCGAEFATGCTYKYLNGGPGAPGFIYVRRDLHGKVRPALSGWLGHEAPFDFIPDYRPANGIERMRVGTPPVIQMAVLDAALDVWDGVKMADVRAKSIELTDLFICEIEKRCPMLELASPRDAAARGSHVSFRFEHGYAVMQALIARGVIGDFRAPDVMRFGFAPLYIGRDDVMQAVDVIEDVMTGGHWERAEFAKKAVVT